MYQWVPAACVNSFSAQYLYFRYGRTGVSVVEMKEYDDYAVIKLPDREIFATKKPECRPSSDSFDELVFTGPYEKGSLVEEQVDWTLISAHTGMVTGMKDRKYLHNTLRVIADSGGAQLKMGTVDYLDPHHVIDWMNRCADRGFTLDVPPRPKDHSRDGVMALLRKASKLNNEIFLKERRSDLGLVNVLHGHRLEDVRLWANELYDDRFVGWAYGPDASTDHANFRGLLVPMFELPDVEHYHLFAYSGRQRIPIMAWLGRYKPLVTSDSSTWITIASRRVYMQPGLLVPRLKPLTVGEKNGEKLLPNVPLPCSCPICSKIKWSQFFKLRPKSGSVAALSLHNLYMLSMNGVFWNHMAQTLSLLEYKKIVAQQFPREAMSGFICDILDYVEYAREEGLDKAENKWKNYLGSVPTYSAMKPLFGKQNFSEGIARQVVVHMMESSESYVRNFLPEDLAKIEDIEESSPKAALVDGVDDAEEPDDVDDSVDVDDEPGIDIAEAVGGVDE